MPTVSLSQHLLAVIQVRQGPGESVDATLRRMLKIEPVRKGQPRKYPVYDLDVGEVAKIPWVPRTEAFMIPDQQRIWQAIRRAQKATGHSFETWVKADAVYVKRTA